mmetsp:Transcript_15732/g.41436  ORF Transcript_15732/g.41436 Transcript_15732/m.41436 type:complete len:340 (+) Transcript_15732:42-1061(+)
MGYAPHLRSSASASSLERTTSTRAYRPSSTVGGSRRAAKLRTIPSSWPRGIVGWSSRAATRAMHASTSASKYTHATSSRGGACISPWTHSRRSAAMTLHRSSTRRRRPADRPTSCTQARRPRSSWLATAQAPGALSPPSRASAAANVDFPEPGSPTSTTVRGARFRLSARILSCSRSAFAAALDCLDGGGGGAAATSSRPPWRSASSAMASSSAVARDSDDSRRSTPGGPGGAASAARRQSSRAYSRTNRSWRTVSMDPGRSRRMSSIAASELIAAPKACSPASCARTPPSPNRRSRHAATVPARPLPPPQCSITAPPAPTTRTTASTISSICVVVGGS